MTRLLTLKEVCFELNASARTIVRLVRRGSLAAYKLGPQYRFKPGDVVGVVQRCPALSSAGKKRRMSRSR